MEYEKKLVGKNREGGKSGAWKAAQGCFREEKPLSWMKVVAVDMREVSVSLGLNSFSVSVPSMGLHTVDT